MHPARQIEDDGFLSFGNTVRDDGDIEHNLAIGSAALNARFMSSQSALRRHMLHPETISYLL